MKKATTTIIVIVMTMIIAIAAGVFAYIKCVKEEKVDYLVLVNKTNKISPDWAKKIQLVEVRNVFLENIKVEKETLKNYKALKEALKKENIYIELTSGYRSVGDQGILLYKLLLDHGRDYVVQYVTQPGYSEHHTGFAIDICLIKDGKIISENEDLLKEKEIFAKIHAKLSDYGFILTYEDGKEEAYEPWHLRYVGSSDVAKEITSKKITLEEYLNKDANKGANKEPKEELKEEQAASDKPKEEAAVSPEEAKEGAAATPKDETKEAAADGPKEEGEAGDTPKEQQEGTAGSNMPLKDNVEKATREVKTAMENWIMEVYGENIVDAKIIDVKVYSDSDEQENEALKEMNLGPDKVAFSVGFELKPSENANINLLMIPDGYYDEESGWVKEKGRLGILEPDQAGYKVTHIGTGW